MKYLKKFLSASTYNDYIGDEYPVPNVSYVKNTEEVFYTEDDYEKMYLTTEAPRGIQLLL